MLGCPYNLHPEKPWLRRAIRGVIATGVVVASPLLVAGALTAAVTVLPSVGIYKLVRHVRDRRQTRIGRNFIHNEGLIFGLNEQEPELMQGDLRADELDNEEILRILRSFHRTNTNETDEDDFPLAIFADMDVENLFSEDDKPPSDFQTCPTTPAINLKNDHSENLQHLIAEEH